MKNSANQNSRQSKAPAINNNRPRPENKDNLDHRENLELHENGGHNKKEMHIGEKDEHNTRQGQRGDNE